MGEIMAEKTLGSLKNLPTNMTCTQVIPQNKTMILLVFAGAGGVSFLR